MIDLSDIAGFPVELDPGTGMLTFGEEMVFDDIGDRKIGELLPVLAFPEAATGRETEAAYLLYRGVRRAEDSELFAEHGTKYDITVTLPGEIGSEQIKTAGHIHSNAPDGAGYPEIYDVLYGTAAFLLQWTNPLRLVIIECEAGERILIPGGASHLTINHGSVPLVVADLVGVGSVNDYGEFRTKRGAAIYLTYDPTAPDSRRQVINHNYELTPTWRTIQGSRVGEFVPDGRALYTSFLVAPADFSYLTAPAVRDSEMQALWIDDRPEA